ncbi:MAG: thioesterase family protein [Ktedonobacteraceae bacterium]|nr:thioesterase family protein [Ktedonobacteraceae bacterium]
MTIQTFWVPEGDDRFTATMHTQGPWNPQFEHGGPPGALLVRQLELCSPRADMMLGRVSINILGPIPIATLSARARLVRPGRSVELLEASLEYEGKVVMQASAWRVRVPTGRPPVVEGQVAAPELPPSETIRTLTPEWTCGFLNATEWRFVQGGYTHSGPAIAWIRPRYPLVPGEEMTPTQRLILSADSANGVSSPLDIRSWQFIPPELTVHILRPPVGEWICLDAHTLIQSEGIGLTTADLFDESGFVGRSGQTLLISRRA